MSLWEFGAVTAGYKKANPPAKEEQAEAPSDEDFETIMERLKSQA